MYNLSQIRPRIQQFIIAPYSTFNIFTISVAFFPHELLKGCLRNTTVTTECFAGKDTDGNFTNMEIFTYHSK